MFIKNADDSLVNLISYNSIYQLCSKFIHAQKKSRPKPKQRNTTNLSMTVSSSDQYYTILHGELTYSDITSLNPKSVTVDIVVFQLQLSCSHSLGKLLPVCTSGL